MGVNQTSVQNDPLGGHVWQFDIQLKGPMTIAQEKGLKAIIAARGGILTRQEKQDGELIWCAQLKLRGPNLIHVMTVMLSLLGRILHGDQVDAARLGCKRVTTWPQPAPPGRTMVLG